MNAASGPADLEPWGEPVPAACAVWAKSAPGWRSRWWLITTQSRESP